MGLSEPPPAFRELCALIHQDVLLEFNSVEELVLSLLSQSSAKRAELLQYVDDALERLTPAEMKGVMNRCSHDIGFSSKGAKEFFVALASGLKSDAVKSARSSTG